MMTPARTRSARWLLCALALVVLSGLATGSAYAQPNTGKVTFTTGVDFTHAYFFRGIRQEHEGSIVQPYADINFDVYSDDDGSGLNGVTFSLGQWHSFHTGPSGQDGPAENVAAWYEADFFTGFALEIDNWEAAITYTNYMSPNDSFGTVQEFSLGLSMDDSAMFGDYSMQPHVLMAIEINGQADGGSSEGVYLEFGVEPGVEFIEDMVDVTFPVTLGLSLNNYYENGINEMDPGGFSDTFGYFDIGAAVAVPLGMPEDYGSWEVAGGFHLLMLGGYLKEINESDGVQVIGSVGLSIGY